MSAQYEGVKLLTPEDIDASSAAVQEVFREVGPEILAKAGNIDHEIKAKDGSPVTKMDKDVEERVKAAMARQFKGMRVYGEETGYQDHMTGAFWLIDPIDGTKAFINNIPTFTSMAVLIQGDEAVASIIYNPSTDEMFTARKGKGAFKNNVQLKLDEIALPNTAYCKDLFIDKLDGILGSKGVHCAVSAYGGGYGFTMVAQGLSAARFNLHSGGQTHDYAPGGLLVREAGGVLIPVLEDTYNFETRSFVACHPALEQTIVDNIDAIRELESMPRG